ncbi:MAG TPA: thiamine phosphate synthase [Terriglobales bacterium]|nr:thiamine phosphate synthase [Terriglobales bacterium]
MLLYYITDRSQFAGDEAARRRSMLAKIAEAATFAVDYIQLREKDLSTRELEALAHQAINSLRAENQEPRTVLLINSRTDVALASGVDGVHLRGDDISPSDVRKIWGQYGGTVDHAVPRATPIIAVSCHCVADVHQAAENRADFAVFGPVFEKSGSSSRPTGVDSLALACKERIPVFALGGINLQNAVFCLEAGAAGIAAIRLFQENEIAATVAALRPRGTNGLPKAR